MLEGVDHELGGNEPEAHSLAGFHGAGRGLHEERTRAAVIIIEFRRLAHSFDR
jgi:hypothetical protein